MKIQRKIIEYKYQILVFISFIISLFFNAIIVKDYDEIKNFMGIDLFFFGLLSFLGGGILEFLIWTANPIAFCSLLFSKKNPKIGIILSIISFVIAISFTKWNEILVSESGQNGKIISLDVAFWIWITTIFLLIILNIYNLILKLKIEKKK
ncbi:hypothetical protein JSO54_03845 [Riemerella anatipestifer]|uniref:hypothetical protein n=1 Tax=Riemerella anatipestifer TaxID=34085 RepID=UPI00137506CF|nr:hypothetical protein [Riemerella anatipestifer]